MSLAKFAFNNVVHSSTERSPFSIAYVKPPRHAVDLFILPNVLGYSVAVFTLSNLAKAMKEIQGLIKKKLEETNARVKGV